MNIKDDFILSKIDDGYLVGGSIRDFGKSNIIDRDIAIKGAKIFAEKLAKQFDAKLIELDIKNQIFRVILNDKINYLDISELRGNSIEEDLLKRDFTINAIAYDLKHNQFIDVTGGLEDLRNGILRHIQEKNFQEDPLRVLRAYRFVATTGFAVNQELNQALVKYQSLIEEPAKERIHQELVKLFAGKYTDNALILMLENGILEYIFSPVKDMKRVPSNTHHHLDLIHHVIETVRQIQLIYENSENEIRNHLECYDLGFSSRLSYLKLAGFLHDIGKFSTWTIEENGRHRFIKHDIVGSEMVIPILKDLKYSKKEIEYVKEMILKHIYPSSVISATFLDDKVKMRYIRRMDFNTIDNITLAKADRLSALGVDVTKEMVSQNINGLNELQKFYLANKKFLVPLPKLLDGNEIMQIKKIKQSKYLGQIVKDLKEAQLNGDITTKSQAIEFVINYSQK